MRIFIWLGLFFTLTLHADQFVFQFYNDYFVRTDKHFTDGFAFSWMDGDGLIDDVNTTALYSRFMYKVVNSIPFVSPDEYKHYTAGVSISQIMLTLKDTSKKTAQQ